MNTARSTSAELESARSVPARSPPRVLRLRPRRCAGTAHCVRILVSNDDGIEAPGLRALAEALLPLGDVLVCAPDREQSASSHSISLHRPLRIEELPPWGPIKRYSVDGTPTDAVYVGVNHLLRKADPTSSRAASTAARTWRWTSSTRAPWPGRWRAP